MSTTEAQRLTAWFDECDGFRQATAAPHKWVLQADAELRRLNDQVEKLKAELASIDGALNDPRSNLTLTTSEIIWELKGQVEKLTQERDEAVAAVQRLGDGQPFDAIVVADTVKRQTKRLEQQLAALAEQNENLRARAAELEKTND